uniref:diphthine methyltransferase isoform X2 n=1 Tax=Myxine glutinosa TaxID=7769 RepID=UPI00358E021D
MNRARTLQVFDTELPADTVEWCPTEGWQTLLACGTYKLVEGKTEPGTASRVGDSNAGGTNPCSSQSRLGHVNLFHYDATLPACPLRALQQWDTAGVLDLKWQKQGSTQLPVLAVASAQGTLDLHQLVDSNVQGDCSQLKLNSSLVLDPTRLVLSLDWANPKHGSEWQRLVCSDSCGELWLIDPGVARPLVHWHAHVFEAWVAAFDAWNPHLLYSGGDDGKLCAWDPRQVERAIFTNTRHGVGVCSISSSPHQEHLLATGSYDEQVFFWDSRSLCIPLNKCEVGGGVWRLKWHPRRKGLLLAAAMHNGFHIIEHDDQADDRNSSCHVVSSYIAHESLAYGADWSWLAPVKSLPSLPPSSRCDDSSITSSEGAALSSIGQTQNFRILYESPTSTFDIELEDEPEQRETQEDTLANEAAKLHITKGPFQESESSLVATCSFYDHMLHVWCWQHD